MHQPTRSGPPRRWAGPGPLRRRVTAAAAALALLLGAAAPAAAQEGEVAGTVVSASGGRPLAGAQVSVEGTSRRVVTDPAGRFRITGLTGGSVTLRVTLLGHSSATRQARVGDTDVRVTLSEGAIALDAMVAVGVGVQTERRALGNAVGIVNAAEVVESAPIENVQGLLNGRAPGVVIQPGSGGVGTGSRIRVRGAGSLSISNEPIIYVDGVRINNNPASGPANQAFGSASISRINDINPEDIDRIEVLRGPAASTLYGSEAGNGVIQIFTKRGATGATQWNFSMKQGVNYLANPEGRFWTNYQRDTVSASPTFGQVVSLDIVEAENARGTPIFRTGHLQEYDLSVAGGSDRFRYFVQGGMEDSEGAERKNDLRRYNARANLTVAARRDLDLEVGMSWVDGVTNLSPEAGYGGRVWTTVLADPRSLTGRNAYRRGFHSGVPSQYDALYNIWQDLNRFTGSLQATHRPFGWMTHRLSFGVDFTREQDVEFYPRVDSLRYSAFGDEALGYKAVTDRDLRYRTLDYSATASFDLPRGVSSRTTAGFQYYKTRSAYVYGEGTEFPAPGLSALGATVRDRFTDENASESNTVGVFGQQQFGLNDRFFVTAGARMDDHSAFGENFDLVVYPKVSSSWVLSEEPFFRFPFVSTLLLRAAYGHAGIGTPIPNSALRTYAPVTGPGDSAAVTPRLIGNPDLGPERGKELEVGFDAGFLDDRLGLEFTWYNKLTEDAILQREIAPSIGFSGLQYFNAGRVRNTGVELLLRGRPLERENVALELTFSVATNRNRLEELGLGDVESVGAGTFLQHREGYPIGSFFEQRVTSARLENGVAVDVMCDDGEGGDVLCAGTDGVYGTADDAPNVYLGRALPNTEGAFTSTLTLFGNLRLYGMVDFKRGQRKVDGNTRVRCTFFGGRCRENFFPEEFDARRIAAIQSNTNLVDFLIDDASFAKLREVSATYSLPDRWARRAGASRASISLAGRNLHTWTDYGGLEPEAMFLGGTRGGNHGAFEQTTLPQLAQWVVSVNLGF